MECSHCRVAMVEGIVGKEPPLNLRFVPKDHKVFVWDHAGVVAYACPKCGGIHLAVDPDALRANLKG